MNIYIIYIIFPGNLVDSKAVIREFHEVHLNGKKYTEMETYTRWLHSHNATDNGWGKDTQVQYYELLFLLMKT